MNEDGYSPNGENLSASSARWIRSANGLSRSEIWSLANLGPRGGSPAPGGGGRKWQFSDPPPGGGIFGLWGGSKCGQKTLFFASFFDPPKV